MKTCQVCKVEKDFTNFKKSKRSKDGYVYSCIDCPSVPSPERQKIYRKQYVKRNKDKVKAYMNNWNKENRKINPEYYANSMLKYLYGITGLQRQEMEVKQNGVCAICKKPESVLNRRNEVRALSVDHSHVSGKVRGLLCTRCNQAIGLFKEDPETFLQAYKYLQEHL